MIVLPRPALQVQTGEQAAQIPQGFHSRLRNKASLLLGEGVPPPICTRNLLQCNTTNKLGNLNTRVPFQQHYVLGSPTTRLPSIILLPAESQCFQLKVVTETTAPAELLAHFPGSFH